MPVQELCDREGAAPAQNPAATTAELAEAGARPTSLPDECERSETELIYARLAETEPMHSVRVDERLRQPPKTAKWTAAAADLKDGGRQPPAAPERVVACGMPKRCFVLFGITVCRG